jgi:hypothetical protein
VVGRTIGAYEVLEKLGAGGMGEVYRARDTCLDRQVAIKVLPDAVVLDPDRLARFDREAKVLATLNHPLIAQGPVAIPDALRLARQIAEAIEAAHDLGIIHRDLKPANIKTDAARRTAASNKRRSSRAQALAGRCRRLHREGVLERILANPAGSGTVATGVAPVPAPSRARTLLPWLLLTATAVALAAVLVPRKPRHLARQPLSRV